MARTAVRESGKRSKLSDCQRELLSHKINELPLKIKGTRLEKLLNQLYRELENAGIAFKPDAYLTDEWGCPHGVPVIGIPFYLAAPSLCEIETKITGVEAENDIEIMMYLRHESGHAFNYAFRLYTKPEWLRIFGQFSRAYNDNFKPIPFRTVFVRHIPGWYVQKHPDEDFAETFAVWLTPNSDWQKRYSGTPVIDKLNFIDETVKKYGGRKPVVNKMKLDTPIEDLDMTLDNWYRSCMSVSGTEIELPEALNNDLRNLLPGVNGPAASGVIRTSRQQLLQEICNWTGINRKLLTSLFDGLLKRIELLDLKIETELTSHRMMGVAIFITTLAMNYLCRDRFVEE